MDSGSFVCVSDIKNIYTCRGLRDWKWSRVKVRLNQYAHGIYNVIIIFIIIAVTTANKTTITTTTTTGAEQLKSVEDKNWPKERKRESEKKKILKKKRRKKKEQYKRRRWANIFILDTDSRLCRKVVGWREAFLLKSLNVNAIYVYSQWHWLIGSSKRTCDLRVYRTVESHWSNYADAQIHVCPDSVISLSLYMAILGKSQVFKRWEPSRQQKIRGNRRKRPLLLPKGNCN